MSEFVHCFKNFDTALSFIRAFFVTEAREWSRIDRLRMDKFMMVSESVICILLLLTSYAVCVLYRNCSLVYG